MIKVKKYNPSIVAKKKSNKIINFLASFILLIGLFLMTAQPTIAKEKNTCSGGGATCVCNGPCYADSHGCMCL